jgi:hypothetical protein
MKPWTLRALSAILVCVALVSCKAPSAAAPGQKATRFSTEQEAEAGGLSGSDLAVLHAFFRLISAPDGKSRECLILPKHREHLQEGWKYLPSNRERHSYVLTNEHGLKLGVLYFPKKDRLWIVEPGVTSYNPVEMRRTKDGYLFIFIQGCVHIPMELVTVKGKPYILRYPSEDLLH